MQSSGMRPNIRVSSDWKLGQVRYVPEWMMPGFIGLCGVYLAEWYLVWIIVWWGWSGITLWNELKREGVCFVVFGINRQLYRLAERTTPLVDCVPDEILRVRNRREMSVNGFTIKTPLFINSISSVRKDVMLADKVIQLVHKAIPQHTLVSAYDLTTTSIQEFNTTSRKMVLALDSGGFELRKSELTKPWDVDSYIEIIKATNRDILVSFDGKNIPFEEQLELNKRLLREIKAYGSFLFDFIFSELTPQRIPAAEKGWKRILAPFRWLVFELRQRSYIRRIKLQILEALLTLPIDIVGIPSDSLGSRLRDKRRIVRSIRQFLDSIEEEIPLHIFGCGDPGEIIALTKCGADIFDGTSWYRKVVWKREEGDYYGIEDRKEYTKVMRECMCKVCMIQKHDERKFEIKVARALHNYFLYADLMQVLQEM